MIAQAVKVHRLIEADKQRLVDENTHLRQELQGALRLLEPGRHAAVRCARSTSRSRRSRGTNTTVLLRGESGTGKELIAHAIHYNSPRAKKPFIKVSCAALPAGPDRVGAVRLREGRVHRRAGARRRGASSWPRAARCSSTRSATSTWPRRSSCCACCRSASSSGSAAPRRFAVERPADRGDQQGPGEGDRGRRRSARISTTG